MPAALGERLGNYRLDEVLGRGGMGTVYAATHLRLERRAAIKVLAAELAHNPHHVSRFFHEARVVARAEHPNIVSVVDFVDQEKPRRVAFVMELIDGPTLSSVVREAPLSVAQAVNAGLQISSALERCTRSA